MSGVTLDALHHVAIVVADIDAEVRMWTERFGVTARSVVDVPEQRSKIAFLSIGGTLLELVQPTDRESGVARFLAERGRSALHHLCFEVDDLPKALDALAAEGVELVDREPRHGAEGDVAFVHPRGANGVLVELIDRRTIRERA